MNRSAIIILLLVLFISCDEDVAKKSFVPESENLDGISSLLEKGDKETAKRHEILLDSAHRITKSILEDSIKLIKLSDLSYYYYKNGDSANFRQINKEASFFAEKVRDTNYLARFYWDLGNFYFSTVYKDSSFYYYNKAEYLYEKKKNLFFVGRMKVNKAIVQSTIRDYVGSEITSYSALRILEPLKKYKQIYLCYNNLGVVYNELEEYTKAIYYHKKALEIQDEISQPNSFKENSLNNIGVVKKNQKNFAEARDYFQEALITDNLIIDNPKLYAMVLDNYYYCSYKIGEEEGIEDGFLRALRIRENIDDKLGVSINYIHLTEFFAEHKDSLQAIAYAHKAYQASKGSGNNRDVLASLLLLSELEKNVSTDYLKTYIKLNDSLQKIERLERNKFARIAYETEKFEKKNAILENRNFSLIILILSVSMVSLFIVITIVNRSRNKTLLYEQKQQKVNEEIYSLMLSQQSKLRQARQLEKDRVSAELHDGILNKLFGLRLTLDFLNDHTDLDSIQKRKKIISEMMNLEVEIREISHELAFSNKEMDIGLDILIAELIESQSKLVGFSYNLDISGDIPWSEMSNEIKMNIYRIIQESIRNIIKHANATFIDIHIGFNKENLILKIHDNGRGFDVAKASKGIGIKNMKSRTTKMLGTFNVKSDANKGTEVQFLIPAFNDYL